GGGFDSTPEELYFELVKNAHEHGYGVLTQLSQLNGQNYRKARKSRPLIQRSPLRRPAGTGSDSAAGGCNPGWRLRWQGEVQLPHEHLLLHWQLGVAGQHQRATVGGRETDVEHLDRGHLIEHGPRR